jgi:hypothetical protein
LSRLRQCRFIASGCTLGFTARGFRSPRQAGHLMPYVTKQHVA